MRLGFSSFSRLGPENIHDWNLPECEVENPLEEPKVFIDHEVLSDYITAFLVDHVTLICYFSVDLDAPRE